MSLGLKARFLHSPVISDYASARLAVLQTVVILSKQPHSTLSLRTLDWDVDVRDGCLCRPMLTPTVEVGESHNNCITLARAGC